MSSSSSLSLAPVRSLRSIRTIRAIRTIRTPWPHVSASCLGGSTDRHFSRRLHNNTTPAALWATNFDHHCCRCLSTSKPLLAGTAAPGSISPVITPKVSKYRIDCNTSKVIKRRKKAKDDHVLKAVPNVVRTKPVANPKKVRLAAEAATREIMRKLRDAEGLTSGTPLAPSTKPIKPSKKTEALTPKPTSGKPEASRATKTTPTAVFSTPVVIAKEPVPMTPEPTASQTSLSSPALPAPKTRLQPAHQQPLPNNVDPIISTLAGSIATQPAPISSGWSTRSPLQLYRLPPPELMDQSKQGHHDYPSLDPLPRMAASIERRPSQAPQRIKRSVYRTILDWSVHPTVQPTDFISLPDLPPTPPPPRAGHSIKSPAASVAATANATSATSADTSDENVAKKRYVSRRRIGFDDDDEDDLDMKFRSRQRRPSVVRLERDDEPRSAPPPPPLPPLSANHPRQTATQVLDAIVKQRLGQNNDTQGNPWSISGIRKQKFSPGEKEKSGLLKRPVVGFSDKAEKEKLKVETAATTATSKPFQSSLPFVSSPSRVKQIAKAVLPDKSLLSSWSEARIDTPKHISTPTRDSTGEYLFSPRAVLPALTTGLRKPFELLYTDSVKHSRSMGSVSKDNTYNLQFDRGPAKLFRGSATTTANKNNKAIESGTASGNATASSSPPPPIWVVLDEVQTINDMGQILNAAFYLGIDGVIIKNKDTVLPLAGVSATSGGTLEKRPVYAVRSLVKFIKESQVNGWQVIGIKAAYGSKRMKPFYNFPATGIDRPTVLVLGGNGLGLSKNVERHCDGFVHVPTLARMATDVNALPVPVVSGIVMSRLVAGRLATSAADDEKRKALLDMRRKAQVVGDDDDDYVSPDPWLEGNSPPEWEELAPGLKEKITQTRYTHDRKAKKN
ncbi:hypothetical protein BGW39_011631 [Mortierella sp. 14UC]|nr:hypothetical protein BGW39_011631 [Mortierella sp. 14UC]